MPTTFGDLRQSISAQRLGWTVAAHLPDATVIPRVAMGADPASILKADPAVRLDVRALVRAAPPANQFLRAHLETVGLLAPVAAATLAPTALAGAGAGGAGGAGGPSRPAVVDWRNRFGWPWITAIRDQDPCEHCWVYAATALVEAMVRIEHCVWSPRSVGDYIEANKTKCGQCGDPRPVLDWVRDHGQCDLDTVGWADRHPGDRTSSYWNPAPDKCGGGSMVAPPGYNPPSTRSGRTTRTPSYTTLNHVDDQKNWLDAVGPIIVTFDVYTGFQGWTGNTPYRKQAGATFEGSHVVLCVGYDDNLQCWILKNSWGPGLGNAGFWLFGYGECKIDENAKLGLRGVNPDPWTKRRSHAGGMIESGNGGNFRNFELVAPGPGNSVVHWWRDNGAGGLPWHRAEQFGNDVADPPTFTGTSFNRNFEMIHRTTAGRLHHRFFDQGSHQWKDGPTFGPANARGAVGFCESGWGPGNFEVVVAVGSSLEHWWRDPGFNWRKSVDFGASIVTAGPSLLQSTWGNLEMVAVNGNGTMQHWYRGGPTWVADQVFGGGIQSPPCMIQGQFGMADDTGHGNFELCVATPAGTIEHWWRTNSAPFPWARSATFGSGIARVVALVESSFGFNLEVIALRSDGLLQHFWRTGDGWHNGVVIGSTH